MIAGDHRRRSLRRALGLALFGAGLAGTAMPCLDALDHGSEVARQRHDDIVAAYQAMEGEIPEERAEIYVQAVVDVGQADAKALGESGSWLPAGTRLAGVEFSGDQKNKGDREIRVVLDLPADFLKGGDLDDARVSRIGREVFGPMLSEGDFNVFMLYARDPKTGKARDINDFVKRKPDPKWNPGVERGHLKLKGGKDGKGAPDAAAKNSPISYPGPIAGALSGKSIFINQSHGWFDDPAVARYRVQRGNCYGITEDFSSPEFINMYVVPALRNAGAKVMTVRESDLQTNMAIVDNSDASGYAETGTWSTSTLNGFKQKTGASWVGVTINPFNQGTGQNRLAATTTGAATATATWTATIPADGYYNVYASWSAYSSRPADAQYLVYHSGGVTEVKVNQKIDGYTWVYLGNFHFEAGASADARKVVLTNVSAEAGTFVSADAVRWGGGMGDVARRANGVSGRPRWEEEAVLSLQWYGFGYSGLAYTGTDDEAGGWADRPEYVKWEHSIKDASVEDALYFAWHTNANTGCGSAARGLSSFRHSTATTASTNLQTQLHDTMYAHISGLWFPGWTVRSKNVTNFGENNQSSLGTGVPGVLMEGLFHDNETDATTYGDPKFRADMGRSIVQGIINYYEQRDSVTLTNPPETPRNLRVVSNGTGGATISWDAPLNNTNNSFYGGAATSYKLYRSSTNGFGFDNGTTVSGTSTTVTGIPTGSAHYFRVVAVNSGGVSFPTETLAAANGGDHVLIVNGFDRNDRGLVPQQTITNAGTQVRLDYRTFQAFDYAVEHAKALAPNGVEISSASNEAVTAGQVTLSDYKAIFWILGEESTANETFSTAEQTAVSNYLALGGKGFFVSGSELGWDLDGWSSATAGDRTFLNSILRTDYVGDSAGTYTIANATTGPLSGLGTLTFSTAAGARYNAEFADRITTSGGSIAALSYSGGSGGTAAVSYEGTSNVIALGFPFETIGSAASRQALMQKAVDFLVFDSAAPAAPTGMAATAGNSTVSLDWANNSEPDLAGYNVWRSTTSGGPYTKINGTLLASSAYVDNTAVNFTTYYYVATAVDNAIPANESPYSSQVSAQPQDTTPPAAPTGLAATAGNSTVALDWNNNSEGDLGGYNVWRSTTSGGPYTKLHDSLVASSAYAENTAANFTTYYYVVTAVDNAPNANQSGNSAQVSAQPQDTTPPAAPTGLAATAGNSTVGLDWNNNSEGDLAGYNVWRGTASGGPYTKLNGSLVAASAYTDNTVTNFTTYYYVVTAVDNTPNANQSGNSAQVSAQPQDTTPPAVPTGLAATAGNATVGLDWNDNGEGDLAGYNVYRGTASGGPYTKQNGSVVATSAYTDNSVTNGTTYYYVVRSVDNTPNANESGNSSQVSATPTAPATHVAVETFEGYSAGAAVMFRNPTYSGSTTGVAAGSTAVTATDDRNDSLDPAAGSIGTVSEKISWSWSTAGTGFIRLTTANMTNRGNPALDLTKGFSMYVKLPAGQLDVQLLVRETGGSGPIGANAGTTGSIERSATAVRVNSSGDWQYLHWDLPNIAWTAYTGNGTLNGTWGSLEALAITAVSGDPTTAFTFYVDDVYQGPAQTPIPNDVTMDNTAASFSGTWSTGTSATDKFGADYRYCNSGASATATYAMNLPAAGQWTIQVWYPAGSNRASSAPHVVTHVGGTATYNINQTATGGQWVTLGTHTFAAGAGQLQIQGATATPTSRVVMADGVRAVWVGP